MGCYGELLIGFGYTMLCGVDGGYRWEGYITQALMLYIEMLWSCT